MENPTLADFLRRALTWPDPYADTGWVNLHWRAHDRQGITGSQAFKTLDDVTGFINWGNYGKGKSRIADIYYCTSLQRDHGDPKKSGRYAALRSSDNAESSKLLFADVDKYGSKRAAIQAILDFCKASNSPYPTAIVDSGGGIHAYWILPEPLPRVAWLDLAAKFEGLMSAHGLKHDNISTDIARILRPPGTFNFKRATEGTPPAPVVLKLLNGDVDLVAWRSLHEAVPGAITLGANRVARPDIPIEQFFVDPRQIAIGPSPVFRGKIPLSERVHEGTIARGPVVELCPMFAETLRTGGELVSQPLWHQQALACTFIFEGRELFHELGCKHPGYTPESSNDMFERKQKDRLLKGLGYPSCTMFEFLGAEQCKTCPLKSQISSPLKITSEMRQAVASKVQQQTTSAPVAVDDQGLLSIKPLEAKGATLRPTEDEEERFPLPDGYRYGLEDEGEDPDFIYYQTDGKKKEWKILAKSKLLDYWLIRNGASIGLKVRCTSSLDARTGKLKDVICTIPPAAFGGQNIEIYKALNEGGWIVMGNIQKTADLMLTFRGQLIREQEAQAMTGYGWVYPEQEDGGEQSLPTAFSYDGDIFSASGVRRSAAIDDKLKETYCQTGKVEPWLTAVKCILDMKSPGLEMVVLCAFAAPLMIFSGHPSTVVMVRGQSGGSKSTASAIASAVWARPRTALIKPASSKLGLMRRMGRIRHLPVIWDDIRNSMFELVKDTLMEITQGGDGLKLDQNREEREQGIWDNMLLTSSNNSLVEYLEQASKNDGAALVRCFEFSVPKVLVGDPGYVDPNYLSPLIAELDRNHGHIGREYASVLGANPRELKDMYKKVCDRLVPQVAPYQPYERFWMAAAATTLMAGMLANNLPTLKNAGIQFDLVALEKFVLETYTDLRRRLGGASVQGDTKEFVDKWLGAFINDHAATRMEVVWTIDSPQTAGKPKQVAPLWPLGDQARQLRRVSVRWITTDRKLRISKANFDAFLRKEKVSVDRMAEGLKKYYGAQILFRRIASGIVNVAAQGQEAIYEIDIDFDTWLDDILMQHATPDDQQEIVRTPSSQTPDPQVPHRPLGRKDPPAERGAS